MSTHKIVPYEIQLRGDNGEEHNLASMENIPEVRNYGDFRTFLEEFLTEHLGDSEVEESRKRTFSVKEFYLADKTVVGKVRKGEYGYEEDKYNVNDEEREENAREYDDSFEREYFFMVRRSVNLPEESAVIILERFEGKGVKSEFEKQLSDFVQTDSVKVEMNPIYTKDIVRELTKADELLRYKLQTERAPGLDYNREEAVNGERRDQGEEGATQKIEIKPEGDEGVLDRLIDSFGDDNPELGFTRAYEGFGLDKISAVVNESGSERTITLERDGTVTMVDILDPSDADVRLSSGRIVKWSMTKHSEILITDLENSYSEDKIKNFQ